jgi:GT2 family glycosyltransferase
MVATQQRLGVVVLNWNGRVRLETCLDSLVLSDHPDFFVLVVDNGSVDGSAASVRARGDVELLALPHNLRFAGGNNAGAARAIELGAEQLLILNNDTTVAPDALRQLTLSLQDRDLDLVGPRIVFAADPGRIWYGGGVFHSGSGFTGHRAIRSSVSAGLDPAGPTDWVTGCALAIRADLWQRLGGLDTRYYIYSEDVDFCLRARAAGARIGYCPTAVVSHDVSATVGGGSSAFKAYHRTRARRQLMRRHGEGRLWPLGLLAQDLAWAVSRLLRGHAGAARAVLAAISESATAEPRYPVEDLIDD